MLEAVNKAQNNFKVVLGRNEQSKNTNNKGAINSYNQAIIEDHNNFPKISNRYSWYEPNSHLDRVIKQGTNKIQTTARNPKS